MKSTTEVIQSILTQIVNPVIGLLFVLAFLFFLWGIFQFISHTDDETARATGKRNLIYGVIGLFIMVAAYALVSLIQGTLGSL